MQQMKERTKGETERRKQKKREKRRKERKEKGREKRSRKSVMCVLTFASVRSLVRRLKGPERNAWQQKTTGCLNEISERERDTHKHMHTTYSLRHTSNLYIQKEL
jgi:hypothetical protein